MNFGITLAGVLALLVLPARADNFGTLGNEFTIDFVNIGNPGNTDDAGAGGGSFTPYGGVGYNYRMGTYEISQDAITKATASGLLNVTAGAHTGAKPAGNMTWYEAAAFVNFLNTSTGHQAAYLLSAGVTASALWSSAQAWQADGENRYRHKDAFYFLPSEDEWYKAAYHKNDGVTANYWDYATGSNNAPTAVASGTEAGTAVYNGQAGPAEVNLAGGLSPYLTMGQSGNAAEWQESAFTAPNNSSSEDRTARGGTSFFGDYYLSSAYRDPVAPAALYPNFGFRVASVPEPSAAMLMIGSGAMLLLRRPSRFFPRVYRNKSSF